MSHWSLLLSPKNINSLMNVHRVLPFTAKCRTFSFEAHNSLNANPLIDQKRPLKLNYFVAKKVFGAVDGKWKEKRERNKAAYHSSPFFFAYEAANAPAILVYEYSLLVLYRNKLHVAHLLIYSLIEHPPIKMWGKTLYERITKFAAAIKNTTRTWKDKKDKWRMCW